jgi:hypothetical protein
MGHIRCGCSAVKWETYAEKQDHAAIFLNFSPNNDLEQSESIRIQQTISRLVV